MREKTKDSFNFSFWERQVWPLQADVIIIGAGVVGLNAALEIKRLKPQWEVIVLDQGRHSRGASTKNAGFVCFGSPTELLHDLDIMGFEQCRDLIQQRYAGAKRIKMKGEMSSIGLKWSGGHECYTTSDGAAWESTLNRLEEVNELVYVATGIRNHFCPSTSDLPLHGMVGEMRWDFEGSLHPAMWMQALAEECAHSGVRICLGEKVREVHSEQDNKAVVETDQNAYLAQMLIYATNAFALTDEVSEGMCSVKNQVLVTQPYDCPLEGTYHSDRGFIYFRAVQGRLLIGGGRHWDDSQEEMAYDHRIEDRLMEWAQRHLGLSQSVGVEYRWIGRLGVGEKKMPLIDEIRPGVWRAVRLGGMGVAIGAQVGINVAQKCINRWDA